MVRHETEWLEVGGGCSPITHERHVCILCTQNTFSWLIAPDREDPPSCASVGGTRLEVVPAFCMPDTPTHNANTDGARGFGIVPAAAMTFGSFYKWHWLHF